MIFKSKALLFSVIGFPFLSFITYSGAAFGPAFYMRNFGVSEGEVATVLGLTAAIAGMTGVILGGIIGDKLRKKYTNGRFYVAFLVILLIAPFNLGVLYSENLYASYIWNFIVQLISPMWVGIAPAIVADLVMPRMRAIAGAFYILMVSMLGLALGPYSVGLLSDTLISQGYSDAEGLKTALAASMGVLIISATTLLLACRYLPGDESSKLDRAKELGEVV
jgi:MFS family permease